MTDAPFSDLPFSQRMEKMGDEAEGVFEQVHDKWARYGFDRPPFTIQNLPLAVRYSPDYVQENPMRFVEVLGMGRNGLKLKLEKIRALSWWNMVMPVWLFAWSSHKQEHTELPLDLLLTIIDRNDVPLGKFREGKTYFNVRSSLLPWSSDDEQGG
tara:strand:+ start:2083 stop:2547 length:465 start_codon:yes stop_codon:yes gene_type:complete